LLANKFLDDEWSLFIEALTRRLLGTWLGGAESLMSRSVINACWHWEVTTTSENNDTREANDTEKQTMQTMRKMHPTQPKRAILATQTFPTTTNQYNLPFTVAPNLLDLFNLPCECDLPFSVAPTLGNDSTVLFMVICVFTVL
jgi:hypothetical protein